MGDVVLKPVVFEPTARRLRVMFNGETVAGTADGRLLIETAVPVHCFPIADVRTDLLVPSRTESLCPCRGNAHDDDLAVGDRLHEDVVWHHPDPIPDCARIKGLLAFWNELGDAIAVDGRTEPRAVTGFPSRAMVRRPVRAMAAAGAGA